MDRRTVLLGTFGLLASPRAVDAQTSGKMYRVGLLSPAGPPRAATYDSRSDIIEVLRDFGYVEGRHLTVERRYADGRVERLGTLAAELVQKPVDVIVTFSPVAGRAAHERTKTIPIVILFAGSDPVELGMVSNLARPEGNVTGVVLGSVLADKRLELLKEVIPGAKRIAMLIAGASLSENQVTDAQQAAARLDIRLIVVDAKDRDYERAFGTIKKQGADGLYVAPSPVLSADRGPIIKL